MEILLLPNINTTGELEKHAGVIHRRVCIYSGGHDVFIKGSLASCRFSGAACKRLS